MEHQLKLLKKKVEELTQENLALREINIKFQLENYKLLQKIESFEKSQIELEFIATDSASKWSEVEYLEESSDPPFETGGAGNTKELIEFDPENEDESMTDIKSDELLDSLTEDSRDVSSKGHDLDKNAEKILDQHEPTILKTKVTDPKEAIKLVYTIAAKKGVFEKLKSLPNVGAKDSLFVNKVLDLLYSREVLANSSALGHQCQSKSHLAARPALDASKLSICRQAFVHRLNSCKLSPDAFIQRLKKFNNFVNHKLQNSRKLLLREEKKSLINDQ